MEKDKFFSTWERFVLSRGRSFNQRQTQTLFELFEYISDRCWMSIYKQLLDDWTYTRLPIPGEIKSMAANWSAAQNIVSDKPKEPCKCCHTRGFLEYINLRFGCRCKTLCTCGHCSNGEGQNFGRKMTVNELYALGYIEQHNNGFFKSTEKNDKGAHDYYNIVIENN